jgi:ATP-dependent protease HslVU (ClpYQ) peptidase subunit
MTCVLAYKNDDTVYLASDSAVTNPWGEQTRAKMPKIFQNGELFFGICGSLRMGQILEFLYTPPNRSCAKNDLEYIISFVIESIRDFFKEYGFSTINNNEELGGNFFIVYRNEIYEVQSDFSVVVHDRNYASIGSGKDLALGALYTLENSPYVFTEDFLTISIKAAIEFQAGVAPPIVILKCIAEETEDVEISLTEEQWDDLFNIAKSISDEYNK